MTRLLTTVTLVGLLIATAAAFAITERLKLTKSPIYATHVSKRFSPTCSCARGHANVDFRLRHGDTLTAAVLDADESEVALIAAQHFPRGQVQLRWSGRTDGDVRAPDGTYRVRIHLAGAHQTILLPNRIVLDTTAPRVISATPDREAFSPDGDNQADVLRISYQLSKEARVLLYLGGRRILRSYRHPASGHVNFNGIAHNHRLRPGRYTLEVGAVDLAGNSTPADARVRVYVRLRYIALATDRISAPRGKPFEIGVSTDAKRYGWQLGGRKGKASGGVLRVRAPKKRGRYVLTVSERGHLARATVTVR